MVKLSDRSRKLKESTSNFDAKTANLEAAKIFGGLKKKNENLRGKRSSGKVYG